MQKLTNKEEEIMQILWKLKKAFVKEMMSEITEDQPHYNTLSTIVRNLEEKGYVSHNAYGNTHQYYPLVSKDEYSKRSMKQLVKGYFEGSFSNVVSFMVKENNLSIEELETLLQQIKKQQNQKK